MKNDDLGVGAPRKWKNSPIARRNIDDAPEIDRDVDYYGTCHHALKADSVAWAGPFRWGWCETCEKKTLAWIGKPVDR